MRQQHVAVLRFFLGLVVSIASTMPAIANAAAYRFEVDVTTMQHLVGDCTLAISGVNFGRINVGDRFFGSFNIPDAALLTNGIKDNTGITNFDFTFGQMHYPVGTRFRDSNFNVATQIGVQVLNGNVVALLGGVYGAADYPYVDFYPIAGNFAANDVGTFAAGTVVVSRVPEPAPAALLAIGLMAMAFRRKSLSSVKG